MGELLEKIKEKITPGKNSLKPVQAVVNQINKALEKNEVKAECMVGGSFAKNTHLRGDHDVDLFVRFDLSYAKEDISKILGQIMPFKVEMIKGSRNYYQFSKNGLDFEVVPVLNVDDYQKAKNVTDMSPLHVYYVNSQVKRNPGLNEEIRITKQFCKANRVYGAESYIQGLSGHVIDLLIIEYGSFELLLRNVLDWRDRVVIDVERHLTNPLKQLNKSKLQSPLVMVDPMQPDRNAAAALSKDKFDLFKKKCKDFLKNPNEDFFKVKKFNVKELREKAGKNKLIILEMWPYKAKNDVMGAKLRQVHEYIYEKLKEKDWPVIEADWEFIKETKTRKKKKDPYEEPHGVFYFIINKEIRNFVERKGPPLNQREDVKKFTNTHSKTYMKDGRLYAKVERKCKDAEEKIEDLLNHAYVNERVKEILIEA